MIKWRCHSTREVAMTAMDNCMLHFRGHEWHCIHNKTWTLTVNYTLHSSMIFAMLLWWWMWRRGVSVKSFVATKKQHDHTRWYTVVTETQPLPGKGYHLCLMVRANSFNSASGPRIKMIWRFCMRTTARFIMNRFLAAGFQSRRHARQLRWHYSIDDVTGIGAICAN